MVEWKMSGGMTSKISPDFIENSKVVNKIHRFSRVLHDAGLRVGPSRIVDAVNAMTIVGVANREDFYWILHSFFVSCREDHPVFDMAFKLFWHSSASMEEILDGHMLHEKKDKGEAPYHAGQKRVLQSLLKSLDRDRAASSYDNEIGAKLTPSKNEGLKDKDFAQMSAEELLEAKNAIAKLVLPVSTVKSRRYHRVKRPGKIDLSNSFSSSLQMGGELILPKYKALRKVEPPLVILADISGSMANYSRMLLHFAHALSQNRRRMHVFLFGNSLTNITSRLSNKDIDEAMDDCIRATNDWSGGTKIGAALKAFNWNWSRRVLGQKAVVLFISDGLERDEDRVLKIEIDRLHRSCKRLIWLNPLLRFDGFKARANGIRTILPHVDEFRPVHSLNTLSDLCEALSERSSRLREPGYWLKEKMTGVSSK